MLSIPNELSDLATIEMIEIEDREISPAALEHSSAKSWFYYFPVLWKTSKSHFRLYEQVDGAILIYRLRAEQERLRLSLFLPPFPFHPAPGVHGNGCETSITTGRAGSYRSRKARHLRSHRRASI
jgi:hypothetical protein